MSIARSQKRLLVAGGNYADVPLIKAAKELGFYVISSGNRPEQLGHKYSDEYRNVDFSDREAMLALAQNCQIDAICSCCNDLSALSVAFVAEQLGLPGHDPLAVAQTVHLKDEYRAFAAKHHIPTPKAKGFRTAADAVVGVRDMTYPVMIKPIDLTGGKGMSKIHCPEEAQAAIDKAFTATRANRIVAEEFIEGSRHGYSAFIRNRQVVFSFIDNEHYFLNPFLVAAASAPSICTEQVEANLREQTEHIANILNLCDGIFHVQFILRDTQPVIIEICRRGPGDLYLKLVSYSTGVDYAKWIVRAAAGMDCSELSQAPPQGCYTRHCVMSAREGEVLGLDIADSIRPNIIDELMWWRHGDIIYNALMDKLGIVFLKFDSQAEMLEKTEQMHTLISVRIG